MSPYLYFILCINVMLGNILVVLGDALSQVYFFEVIRPKSLRYTYEIRRARDFGVDFVTLFKSFRLVPAEPYHACSPLSNNHIVKNSIALVHRGECSFLSKTLNAEEAGAVAVLVTDVHKGDDLMVDMVRDGTDRTSNIPALYLPGNHGRMLHRYFQSQSEPVLIDIPLNLTYTPLHHVRKPPWDLW